MKIKFRSEKGNLGERKNQGQKTQKGWIENYGGKEELGTRKGCIQN
jgi:hypothetical protein